MLTWVLRMASLRWWCPYLDTTPTTVWLESRVAKWETEDDVFSRAFLEIVVFTIKRATGATSRPDFELPQGLLGIRELYITEQHDLLPGPHICVNGALWQVMRLFEDKQGSFWISTRLNISDGKSARTLPPSHSWILT